MNEVLLSSFILHDRLWRSLCPDLTAGVLKASSWWPQGDVQCNCARAIITWHCPSLPLKPRALSSTAQSTLFPDSAGPTKCTKANSDESCSKEPSPVLPPASQPLGLYGLSHFLLCIMAIFASVCLPCLPGSPRGQGPYYLNSWTQSLEHSRNFGEWWLNSSWHLPVIPPAVPHQKVPRFTNITT